MINQLIYHIGFKTHLSARVLAAAQALPLRARMKPTIQYLTTAASTWSLMTTAIAMGAT
jgi:hypothetical protein